jgi:hypothetical protein
MEGPQIAGMEQIKLFLEMNGYPTNPQLILVISKLALGMAEKDTEEEAGNEAGGGSQPQDADQFAGGNVEWHDEQAHWLPRSPNNNTPSVPGGNKWVVGDEESAEDGGPFPGDDEAQDEAQDEAKDDVSRKGSEDDGNNDDTNQKGKRKNISSSPEKESKNA